MRRPGVTAAEWVVESVDLEAGAGPDSEAEVVGAERVPDLAVWEEDGVLHQTPLALFHPWMLYAI